MKISAAIESRHGFQGFFRGRLETWWPWIAFFKVLQGEALDKRELELFRACTGLEEPPPGPFREVYCICGRRSGKTTASAVLAATFALWGNWEKHLSRGERARVFIVSPTMQQGQILKGYLDGLFGCQPALERMVKRTLQESIELRNNVTLEIKPASWRSTRGYSCGMLILEEVAFFRFEVETANPDREVYNALLPAMTTIPGAMVMAISTPFARQGLLYEKFEKYWAKPGPVLIWRAKSWQMNLTLDERKIREQYLEALGPAEFGAEYEAAFREDIEQYLPLEVIESSIVPGVEYLGPRPGMVYHAFADASEGLRKGADSMTLGISHVEPGGLLFLDLLLEWIPPFQPKEVISIMAETARLYRVFKIRQDRHSLGWIASDLEPHKISVEVSSMPKSEIYQRLSVLMSKGLVRLLDLPRLKSQLVGLQRFLHGGGQATVDHLRSGKDDCANSAAGAVVMASEEAEVGGPVIFASRAPYQFDQLVDDYQPRDTRSAEELEAYFRRGGR